jgi:OmpR-family two-component system manganese-sensing sensor histidine kinase
MFQATRRRLAIWYTTVTAVLLLLFACSFYWYVRTTLIERIDDTLKHVIEVVERSLVIESTTLDANPSLPEFVVDVEASFGNNLRTDAADDDHIDLEWFSPTGELLWSTLSEPLEVPLRLSPLGETVRLTSHQWSLLNYQSSTPALTLPQEILLRQVTDRVEVGRQVLGYLRVSHPWFEVTKPIRQLLLDLIWGTIITLVVISAIGWFLSGLAIEPVQVSYQRLKQFTADASHELRNPIATIQTNVQVALAEADLNPTEQQHLQIIERLTRRLGRLVEDLLFLARQDSGIIQAEWTTVPLDGLLMEVVEEQTAIATAREIDLSLQLHDPVGSIATEETFSLAGDWDQLVRLFTNLVTNALQYTPNQGTVKVTLQPISKGQRMNSSIYTGDSPEKPPVYKLDGLQITIQDSGCGIPPDALPQIFERFYRVDPARSHRKNSGSGLGLAIALAIVTNHRGQIYIHSQVNQGTTLTVILPYSQTD